MNLTWKKTFKALIFIFIALLISTIIINILYYFNVINNNVIRYFKLLLSLFSFFIGGIYIGKNSPNKGYLYGLRLSLLTIIMLMIFSIIFNNFKIIRIIYYLIVTFVITFGSMIGINKKNVKTI